MKSHEADNATGRSTSSSPALHNPLDNRTSPLVIRLSHIDAHFRSKSAAGRIDAVKRLVNARLTNAIADIHRGQPLANGVRLRHGRIRLQPDEAILERQAADLVRLRLPFCLRNRSTLRLTDIIMHIAFRRPMPQPIKDNRKEHGRQSCDDSERSQKKILVRRRLID